MATLANVSAVSWRMMKGMSVKNVGKPMKKQHARNAPVRDRSLRLIRKTVEALKAKNA